MGRIKYQEAIGLTSKRGRPPAGPAPSRADLIKLYVKESRSVQDVAAGRKGTRDIAGRFIRAGLPAPRQLILDQGKDLNEFYHLMQSKKY